MSGLHRPQESAELEDDKRPYQDGPVVLAENEDVQPASAWLHDRFPHARGPRKTLVDMGLERAFEERIPSRAEGVEVGRVPDDLRRVTVVVAHDRQAACPRASNRSLQQEMHHLLRIGHLDRYPLIRPDVERQGFGQPADPIIAAPNSTRRPSCC